MDLPLDANLHVYKNLIPINQECQIEITCNEGCTFCWGGGRGDVRVTAK